MSAAWGLSWTTARADLVRQLWSEGYSAGQIAGELSISRNAAIGKIHRMKLPPREVIDGAWPADRAEPPRGRANSILAAERKAAGNYAGGMIASIKAKRSHKSRAGSSHLNTGVTQRINNKANGFEYSSAEPHHISIGLAEFNAAIPPEQRVTIIGLSEAVCHWPLWDGEDRGGFYCGGQVMDGHRVYCSGHAQFGGAGYARERGYGFKRSVNTYR